ncbi:transposable element Tcb1 transposase [Trichonephila clavipes]|nr:transposable element Tcb1 transposase [Trichonephila clavipes]
MATSTNKTATFGVKLIHKCMSKHRYIRKTDCLGYAKSLVYADKPQTLDHSEDNIRRVFADIRPQMLGKVIENWTSRLDYIRASRGSPMPEIIFNMHRDCNFPSESSLQSYGAHTEVRSEGATSALPWRTMRRRYACLVGRCDVLDYLYFADVLRRRSSENHLSVTKCDFQDLEPFLETGSAGRTPGQGRRRATTPNEDRSLVLTARRHRNKNAIHLQQHLRSANGTTVSTQTVRNRTHGVALYARRPMVCVRLTSRNRRDHREWATEHVNWRRNEWSNVLFSDESRFSLHPDNRRIFTWMDRCSRNNNAFVHESVRFGGEGVLVYVGISIDRRRDPYIIRDGPLSARRYRDEILRPIEVPYAAAIGDDFILMDDNCRPHRANLVDFFFEEGIVRMEWPASSPDMNPIEHVWDALRRRVAGYQPPPQTLEELERALLEERDRIPQLVINSLIDSMPQRFSALLAVRGNHTPFSK